MLKKHVLLGHEYRANVRRKKTIVRIERGIPRKEGGGWVATNLGTGWQCRIATCRRLKPMIEWEDINEMSYYWYRTQKSMIRVVKVIQKLGNRMLLLSQPSMFECRAKHYTTLVMPFVRNERYDIAPLNMDHEIYAVSMGLVKQPEKVRPKYDFFGKLHDLTRDGSI